MFRPRAILLDIGDTMLRQWRYDLAPGIDAIVADHGIGDGQGAPDAAGLLAELTGAVERTHAEGPREFSLKGWLADRYQAEPDGAAIDRMEAVIWGRSVTLTPMDGIGAALEELHAAGVRIGAVSNTIFSRRRMLDELALHGLDARLDFVTSSAEFGVRKPDPRIFHDALGHVGAHAGETWFVGDSWHNDIGGAHRSGLHPVWLAPPDELPDGHAAATIPHDRVASWEELIRRWRALPEPAGHRARPARA